MKIVYQSSKYSPHIVYNLYGRKLAEKILRIFEVNLEYYTVREYDIEATSILADGTFDDYSQHKFTDNQLTILTRLVTIDSILADL